MTPWEAEAMERQTVALERIAEALTTIASAWPYIPFAPGEVVAPVVGRVAGC